MEDLNCFVTFEMQNVSRFHLTYRNHHLSFIQAFCLLNNPIPYIMQCFSTVTVKWRSYLGVKKQGLKEWLKFNAPFFILFISSSILLHLSSPVPESQAQLFKTKKRD